MKEVSPSYTPHILDIRNFTIVTNGKRYVDEHFHLVEGTFKAKEHLLSFNEGTIVPFIGYSDWKGISPRDEEEDDETNTDEARDRHPDPITYDQSFHFLKKDGSPSDLFTTDAYFYGEDTPQFIFTIHKVALPGLYIGFFDLEKEETIIDPGSQEKLYAELAKAQNLHPMLVAILAYAQTGTIKATHELFLEDAKYLSADKYLNLLGGILIIPTSPSFSTDVTTNVFDHTEVRDPFTMCYATVLTNKRHNIFDISDYSWLLTRIEDGKLKMYRSCYCQSYTKWMGTEYDRIGSEYKLIDWLLSHYAPRFGLEGFDLVIQKTKTRDEKRTILDRISNYSSQNI